jgi:hypothetical protein
MRTCEGACRLKMSNPSRGPQEERNRGPLWCPEFWSGEPWRLWVTDQPDGGGSTVLTLQFAAVEGDMLANAKTSPQLAVSSPEIAEVVMASFPVKPR